MIPSVCGFCEQEKRTPWDCPNHLSDSACDNCYELIKDIVEPFFMYILRELPIDQYWRCHHNATVKAAFRHIRDTIGEPLLPYYLLYLQEFSDILFSDGRQVADIEIARIKQEEKLFGRYMEPKDEVDVFFDTIE